MICWPRILETDCDTHTHTHTLNTCQLAEFPNSRRTPREMSCEEGAHGLQPWLGGGWTNPSEKNARQIGSFPQGSGWKKKIFENTT